MSQEATARKEIPASAAILALVQQKANALREEAQAQAEGLRQEAYKSGYEAGLEEGRRVAQDLVSKQYQDALALVQQQQVMQQEQLQAWFREMEPEMHRVMLEIAATVIKRQVEVEPDIIVTQVRAALDTLSNAAWVRVKVNPVHLPALEQAQLEAAYAVRAERIEYAGDERVTPGGCLVEAPGARVDATVEGQLERVSEAISRVSTP